MIRQLILLPEAEAEVLEAMRWYEERERGLGMEFVAKLDSTLAALRERPQQYPLWEAELPFRKAILHFDSFPAFLPS